MDVLLENGVASIDRLSRNIFEARSKGGQDLARRKRGPIGKATPSLMALTAEKVHPDNRYTFETISISFSAKEKVVWNILHAYSTDPAIVVIAEFSHKTLTDIEKYDPDRIKRGDSVDSAYSRFLSDGVLSGAAALSRSERIIAGDELIRVDLTLDVYIFNSEGIK